MNIVLLFSSVPTLGVKMGITSFWVGVLKISGERMVASVFLIKTLGGGWNGTTTP